MKLKNPEHKQVKNIIFDFGNVLLDIDISLSIKAFKQLGLENFKVEDIHPNNSGPFLDLELGNISTEEFIEVLKSQANDRIPTNFEVYNAWNMLLLQYDFSRFELLEKLKENYRIFLLSNTNLPHREYFVQKFNAENPAGTSFESYFEQCFYSDAMHMRKPDAEIYEQVLKETGINAGETLFIDDNACNLVTASELGILTYHLRRPDTVINLFK